MATPDQIAAALLTRCSTLAVGSPVLPIAMPDEAFTPPESGKYLAVTIFDNRPAWEGLASGRLDQGLLQVTVVWPRKKGAVPAKQAAAAVMGHFPKALMLGNGVKVSGEPYVSTPILDDSETRVPVTIPWTA